MSGQKEAGVTELMQAVRKPHSLTQARAYGRVFQREVWCGDEDSRLLGYDALESDRLLVTFQPNLLPQS
jgi:hypothetical protein